MFIKRDHPRLRRLRSDWRAMQQLRAESSLLELSVEGDPPDLYRVRFYGRGLWRPEGCERPLIREIHDVLIKLGAGYPRMMPELSWRTPIFHPNISAGGVVCLGGYASHWAPSLSLDALCVMLWDMLRYENFDISSPFNREAALWAKTQTQHVFPIDPRPIRNRLSGQRSEDAYGQAAAERAKEPPVAAAPLRQAVEEMTFLESSSPIYNAELVESSNSEILFID